MRWVPPKMISQTSQDVSKLRSLRGFGSSFHALHLRDLMRRKVNQAGNGIILTLQQPLTFPLTLLRELKHLFLEL